MSRYIERDKLINELQHLPEQERLEFMGVYDCVKTTPTADVVEIIRCKDCRNYYEYDDFDRSSGQFYKAKECNRLQCDLGECGFCSYGERKDKE